MSSSTSLVGCDVVTGYAPTARRLYQIPANGAVILSRRAIAAAYHPEHRGSRGCVVEEWGQRHA